ncbi:MAG: DNA polymerase III subunit gamma/tau [Mariprofundaceae bacterium]|nr:DNA polymerase III subunit gamma/tau [Mariprofundaceae bacterium]
MSYLVLARRWRPQRFADLVGQDVVVRTLKNALTSKSLAHAYLLTGIRGVGKTTIARLMAMASNCQNTTGDGEPCRTCDACVAIASGSHLDVRELDAASHTGVDDMRDMLDDVRYPPVNLAYKVYIIDEAHMLSKSAFNALLKTLEEPPERVLFILATTESDKLPVTVRSRCQRFDLRRLGVQEIADYLAHVLDKEGVAYEQEALFIIARSSDGSVRDALSLTERVLAFSNQHIMASDVRQSLGLLGPDMVQQLSDFIAQGNPLEAVSLLRKAVTQGYAARQVLLTLSEQWHQLACMIVDASLLHDEPSEQTQVWLKHAVSLWCSEALDMRYQILLSGLRDLGLVDEQRGAEMVVMRLCHLKKLLEPNTNMATNDDLVVQAEQKLEPKKALSHEIATPPKVAQTITKHTQKEPAMVLEAAEKKYAKESSGASHYTNWEDVMTAYAHVNPPVTAILEQVQCESFTEEKLILALDVHQMKFLRTKERDAFQTWLKKEVLWKKKVADSKLESVADIRQRRQQDAKQQRWQEAEQDEMVNMLVKGMDCRLVDVQTSPQKNVTNGVDK